MMQPGCTVKTLCAAVARRAQRSPGGRTRDTRLADILTQSGPWRNDMPHRHTPVASNHFPSVSHGTVQRFFLNGCSCGCRTPTLFRTDIAVQYPYEDENDPVGGLWWVCIG